MRSRAWTVVVLTMLWAGTAVAQSASGSLADTTRKKRHARGFGSAMTRTPEAGGITTPAAPSAPAPAAAASWEPFVGMDAQIFPSFVVSTATLRLPQEDEEEEDPREKGEGMGFIGAAFEGVRAGARLKVEIKPNAAMEASAEEAVADDGPGAYQVFPRVNYRFDALLDWRQSMPINLAMEAFVDGRSLGVRTTTVTVRSINDCPMAVLAEEDADEEDLDLSWMFAAYVNEDHPWVDTLTREALRSGKLDAFTGYQEQDEAEVLRQVYAIWHVLQQRGVRYSDISSSSAPSGVVPSQHVRLFEETVTAQQANCVDGTVALAAILRKIGLSPYLVTMPGHMLLAFDLDAEGGTTVGLETTMIGGGDAPVPPRNGPVPRALVDRFRNEPSFRSFAAAIAQGTAALEEHFEDFEGDDPEYQMISLDAAREIGIQPLAFRKR
ncbi:MAG: hypothetical protein KJ067_01875 [Vicinamibacteria bacterium]|jgi:hypothetical protein|nr:hypothetical protein [Vicinamibacteria bacterium]